MPDANKYMGDKRDNPAMPCTVTEVTEVADKPTVKKCNC
jgi:hypothetical protein